MIDKIAEAASSAVEALRSTPVLLSLVLFQFLLLGAVVWIAHEERSADHARFQLLVQQCGPKT